MPELKPDVPMARSFIDLIAKGEDVTLQTFDDNKERKDWSLAHVYHGRLEAYADELIRLNSAGAGIFLMINAGDGEIHPGNKTCRTTKNVARVRALFLDLDGAPLEPVLQQDVVPHVVVESSLGKWHVYWKVSDCPLSDFKERQLSLAKRFDGDPVPHDLPRVMRLPGFFHLKARPFMSRLAYIGGKAT